MKTKLVPIRLSSRLKVARVVAGLDMRELGDKANVCPSTICRAEAGKAPSLAAAILLARALGHSVEDLWDVETL